jgi:replicative DNA helicase
MVALRERNEKIDRVTVAGELSRCGELESVDGLSYLVSLDDGLPAVPNIDSYIRAVKEKSTLRQIIFRAQHLMNRAMVEDLPKDILNDARDSLFSLGVDESDGGPQSPKQIIDSAGGISALIGPQKQGLSTGFVKYDEMTGGLHPGELTIIAARPSVGKSAMALNIAQHVALKLGKTVMFFSLEMSKESLIHRLMCTVARVDSQRVRHGYIGAEEKRRLAAALAQIYESNLFIDDKSAATPSDMFARIRRQMTEGPVDLVVGDYLQLMSTGKNEENRNQEVSQISRGLKLSAKELDVPMVVLSQLSRAVETRKGSNRPQLSDLRESGSIEQDADVVNFIFREEMYHRDRQDLRGLAELIVAKQRSGPTGTVNLVFLHSQTKFENRVEDYGEPVQESL